MYEKSIPTGIYGAFWNIYIQKCLEYSSCNIVSSKQNRAYTEPYWNTWECEYF